VFQAVRNGDLVVGVEGEVLRVLVLRLQRVLQGNEQSAGVLSVILLLSVLVLPVTPLCIPLVCLYCVFSAYCRGTAEGEVKFEVSSWRRLCQLDGWWLQVLKC
jgi:hypothetical protein